MITARDYSLSGDRHVLSGDAIVLFDGKNNPVVMVVTISPTLTKIYTHERSDEFQLALKQYGVTSSARAADVRL